MNYAHRLSHGHTVNRRRTPEFIAWHNMICRCTKSNNPVWAHYGGRGVKVCDRWLASFQNFIDDMGCRPSKSHSLDRVDNDGDYEPKNCRWATKVQQSANTRRVVLITYNGETMCVSHWAKRLGISSGTLRYRLSIGLSLEDALQPNTLLEHRRGKVEATP